MSTPTPPCVHGNTPAQAEAFAVTRSRLITIPGVSETELSNNPKGKKSSRLNLQDLAWAPSQAPIRYELQSWV